VSQQTFGSSQDDASSAPDPTAVLLLPVLLNVSAASPTTVFSLPSVLPSASNPMAVLPVPVVLLWSAKFPLRILLRGDSGFAREALMAWCENNGVDFLIGLAKNSRLVGEIAAELTAAQEQSQRTEKPARRRRGK